MRILGHREIEWWARKHTALAPGTQPVSQAASSLSFRSRGDESIIGGVPSVTVFTKEMHEMHGVGAGGGNRPQPSLRIFITAVTLVIRPLINMHMFSQVTCLADLRTTVGFALCKNQWSGILISFLRIHFNLSPSKFYYGWAEHGRAGWIFSKTLNFLNHTVYIIYICNVLKTSYLLWVSPL